MDHGDDFAAWCGDGGTVAVHRADEDWAQIARFVRQAANKVGGPSAVPLCLPGEPQECGRAAREHVLAYAAALKAHAQRLIDTHAPAPAHAAYAGTVLYQRKLSELRATT